jgi:hypothetical protein
MFEIASEVLRWHRSNETGVVARVVSVNGLATRWPAQAIAATGRRGPAWSPNAVTDPATQQRLHLAHFARRGFGSVARDVEAGRRGFGKAVNGL